MRSQSLRKCSVGTGLWVDEAVLDRMAVASWKDKWSIPRPWRDTTLNVKTVEWSHCFRKQESSAALKSQSYCSLAAQGLDLPRELQFPWSQGVMRGSVLPWPRSRNPITDSEGKAGFHNRWRKTVMPRLWMTGEMVAIQAPDLLVGLWSRECVSLIHLTPPPPPALFFFASAIVAAGRLMQVWPGIISVCQDAILCL